MRPATGARSNPSQTFGWELLYQLFKKDIQGKHNVLLLLVHWYMLKSRFRCLGMGDERQISADDVESEQLPPGWNMTDEISIRYVRDNHLYIMHCYFDNDSARFDLMEVEGQNSTEVVFKTSESVALLKGTLSQMIPFYGTILEAIKISLLGPLISIGTHDVEIQTSRTNTTSEVLEPRLTRPPRGPPGFGGGSALNMNFVRDINSAGRQDVNPPRSGMYPRSPGPGSESLSPDPFHPGFRENVPPDPGLVPGGVGSGAIQPGARFDPFGPVDPNNNNNTQNPPGSSSSSSHSLPPDMYS